MNRNAKGQLAKDVFEMKRCESCKIVYVWAETTPNLVSAAFKLAVVASAAVLVSLRKFRYARRFAMR